MKKNLVFIALLLMATAMPFSAHAYDFSAVAPTGQTLYFNISGNNVTVTYPYNYYYPYQGYTKPTGHLTIPSSVTNNGTTYSVTSIGNCAFYSCYITSVTIPNSVTSIGDYAFNSCSNLTSVTIPNSVTSIGDYAFCYCDNLTTTKYTGTIAQWCAINFSSFCSNPTTSSHNLYINNSIITNLVIPNSVTSIGDYAFAYCSGLTSVTIPNSVTYIQDVAFYGCSSLTEITSHATSAPSLGNNVFSGVSSITVNIPCGSTSSYNSIWGYDFDFVEHDRVLIVMSSDTAMGNVNVLTQPDCQTHTAVFNAVPNTGYHFDHWSDGVTDNPRTIITTTDTTIVAFFAPNSYLITTSSNDSTMGTVSGGGYYNYNTTQTLVAEPAEGHHFIRWTDGNTDNPRSILIEGDSSYTAVFAIDTLTVNVSSNNMVYGNVSGGGEFVYGSPCTIEATAYSGYEFVRWSNGVTYNPYTFAVLTNMDIVGVFAPEGSIHNVTVQVQPAGSGTVTGDGPYADGETATLEAVANEGWHFERWSDNNTSNPRTVVVTSDISLIAHFASDNPQGIDDNAIEGITIWSANGNIYVEGAGEETVHVFDIMGRPVGNRSLPAGVYMVKVGTYPARKVVVIK